TPWDGSREAARAIRDAIPLLQRAEEVLLLTIDPTRQGHVRGGPNTEEFGAHLGRHGARIVVEEVASKSKTVSKTVLSQASEFGADLLRYGRLRTFASLGICARWHDAGAPAERQHPNSYVALIAEIRLSGNHGHIRISVSRCAVTDAGRSSCKTRILPSRRCRGRR